MDRTEKVLLELFQVKGMSYISRPMLIKAIIVLYDKLNQVLLDLYCIDRHNEEFNSMDEVTRARMEDGKRQLKEQGKAPSLIKIIIWRFKR